MRFGDRKPSLIHFLHKQEAQQMKSLISRWVEKSWATNGEKLMFNILNLNTVYFAEWATEFKHLRSYMIWLNQTLNCQKKAILMILSLGREIRDHRLRCNFYITPLLSTAQGKSNTQIFLNLWHGMSHRPLCTLQEVFNGSILKNRYQTTQFNRRSKIQRTAVVTNNSYLGK